MTEKSLSPERIEFLKFKRNKKASGFGRFASGQALNYLSVKNVWGEEEVFKDVWLINFKHQICARKC